MDVFVDNVTGAHGAPLSEDTVGPAVGDHGQVALMRPPTLWPLGPSRPRPGRSIILASMEGVVGPEPLRSLRGPGKYLVFMSDL